MLNGQAPVHADLAHRLELAGLGTARHLAEQQAGRSGRPGNGAITPLYPPSHMSDPH